MAEVIHELPPNAGRVIESLRDAGYEFETAIADIVDNSLSAGAELVAISAICSKRDGSMTITIADNGKGMSLEEICNAMTYGSMERSEEHSLGKFGLGLKTASTSQCRQLSLISRNSADMTPVKIVLDIDRTSETNKWEYLEVEPEIEDLKYLNNVAPYSSGTVVRWQKCDRILGKKFSSPGGTAQQKAFDQKLKDLSFHLGLVFQRFLDSNDDRAKNAVITLNGTRIAPWDPFCRKLAKTEEIYCDSPSIRDAETGEEVKLDVAAYVVPARDELMAQEEPLVFPEGISPDKLQGIYFYRENRLIHCGDWCKLAKTEFHQRLCRIEISFSEELDECFQVDFKKSRVVIDPSIAEWLKPTVLDPARSAADKRYRSNQTKAAKKEADTIHQKAINSISKKAVDDRAFAVQKTPDNKLEITNAKGSTYVEDKPVSEIDAESPIKPVEDLPGDLLWRPGLYRDSDGRMATCVEINISHPYYQKAYKACKGNDEAIKALDYLLWSLADAEYASKDSVSAENFDEMRREVSHSLLKLSDSMRSN